MWTFKKKCLDVPLNMTTVFRPVQISNLRMSRYIVYHGNLKKNHVLRKATLNTHGIGLCKYPIKCHCNLAV